MVFPVTFLAPVSRRLCFLHRFVCLLLEYLNKVHSEFDELLRVDNLNGNYLFVVSIINNIIQVLCPEFAAVFYSQVQHLDTTDTMVVINED